jgi:hypothetical protein
VVVRVKDAPWPGRRPKGRREPTFADEWEPVTRSPREPAFYTDATAPPAPARVPTAPAAPPVTEPEPPRSAHVRLPTDAAMALRALALDVASEMRAAHGDARAIGVGEAARLLLIHDGRLGEPSDDLTRRRVAALRRVSAREAGARRA